MDKKHAPAKAQAHSAPAAEATSAAKDFTFQALRSEITYEANLIVQRTSWFVASQAFFFSSLAIDPIVKTRTSNSSGILYFPYPIVPVLALAVCVLTIVSVHAAAAAAAVYRNRLNTFVADNDAYALLWKKPSKRIYVFGLASTLILPYVFLAAWGYIIVQPLIVPAANVKVANTNTQGTPACGDVKPDLLRKIN